MLSVLFLGSLILPLSLSANALEIAVFLIDPRRQANDPLDETTKLYSLADWNKGKQDQPMTGIELFNQGYEFKCLVWSTGTFLSVFTRDPQIKVEPKYRDITVYLVDPYRQAYDPLDETTKLYPMVEWNNGIRDNPLTGAQLMKKGHKFLQLLSMDGGFFMLYAN